MRKTRLSALLLALSLGACAAHRAPLASDLGANTLNVADAALVGGNPGLALRVAQAILRRDPHNRAALVREGDALFALRQIPAAASSYRAALARAPHDPEAAVGLGRCLLGSDPKAAAAEFRIALAARPEDARALIDLGIASDLALDHK
ncbi:MAG: tetratricopeptide repeat protein, partial [Acetobacteraceae bacterium]